MMAPDRRGLEPHVVLLFVFEAFFIKELIYFVTFALQDSRPTEEYIIGHIPGAVRVDYEADSEALLSAIPELQSPGWLFTTC